MTGSGYLDAPDFVGNSRGKLSECVATRGTFRNGEELRKCAELVRCSKEGK
jgi:hypothetical protein